MPYHLDGIIAEMSVLTRAEQDELGRYAENWVRVKQADNRDRFPLAMGLVA